MATAIQLLRSAVPYLRPDPGVLADGMPMVNLAEQEPGLYFRLASGGLTKIGPAHVGNAAPNISPQGFAGNTKGELWVDTSNSSVPTLKAWDGTAWVEVAGGAPAPSPTPPNTPSAGDLWFDTANGTLNYWNGSQWVALTETAPGGTSSNVQYNRNGAFFGTNTFTFDELTSKLSVTSVECGIGLTSQAGTFTQSLIAKTAQVEDNLTVQKSALISENLTVTKEAFFQDNATVSKNLTVTESALFQDNVTVSKNLTVTKEVFFQDNATVSKSLTVTESALFQDNVTVSKNLTVTKEVFFQDNATVSQNLTVTKEAIFQDNATVSKNLAVTETVSAKEFKLSTLPSLP